MNCKNCGDSNIAKFCANCGQKNISARLNFKELKNNFFDSILNYDNKFIKTVSAIFLRLNILTEEYISGKRKKYYNPIKLLFIILSIRTLTEIKLYENIDDHFSNLINNGSWNLILLVGLIPVFSLLSFIFFKSYKYNYIEHIIINSLIYAGVSLLLTFLNTLNIIIEYKYNGLIGTLIALISFTWFYSKVFRHKKIITVLLSAIIYLIGLVFFSSFIILATTER